MKPVWNKIEFAAWETDEIMLSTNQYGEGPIILQSGIDCDVSVSAWITPDEARALAAKLIEAADAVDAAGKRVEEEPK